MHVTHVQEVWHRPKGGLCGIDLVWHTHIKRVCVCVWHTPCVAYTHQKEACHTLKDTNSHTHSSALRMVQDDISMSLITHMHESCPTYALASHPGFIQRVQQAKGGGTSYLLGLFRPKSKSAASPSQRPIAVASDDTKAKVGVDRHTLKKSRAI